MVSIEAVCQTVELSGMEAGVAEYNLPAVLDRGVALAGHLKISFDTFPE